MIHESESIELVGVIVTLLLIAGGVRALTKHINLPFTVALVLVGIALRKIAEYGPTFLAPIAEYEISPDVILFVFLPTLIFESAYNLDVRQFRQNLLPILTLAVPGLIISTTLIGVVVWLLTPFDLPSALLLGAILSATDPVAVIALFRTLGVPMRLTILVEGESLLNDATAIVAARILMSVVAGGYVLTPLTALGNVVEFFVVFLGGALVGTFAALAFGWVLGRVKSDPFIETSLTTVLAYLSFLVAEEALHVSGVMATVAAGITMGSWGRAKISASVTEYIDEFWEYMAFLANALIFLFVGLRVDLWVLYDSLDNLVWVIFAMLLSRAVVIYGLVPLIGRLPGALPVGRTYQAIMYWGGLRGAIALAIVLSLKDFAYADIFVALVMGAVLFTLLVQGITIEKLVHYLGLDQPPITDRIGRAEGLHAAKQGALKSMPELQAGGLFSARIAEQREHQLIGEIETLRLDLDNLRHHELDTGQEQLLIYSRAFGAEKSIYYEMFSRGHLSERAYRDLCHAIDLESDALRHGLPLPSDPLHYRRNEPLRFALYRIFDVLFGFTGLPERLRLHHVARQYEESWGRYHGCSRILADLETLVQAEGTHPGIVAETRKRYGAWMDAARQQIDETARQFPEYTNAMQDRLSKRLLLHAESEIIKQKARAGSIPAGVHDTMIEELMEKIHGLSGGAVAELKIDPAELLRKVPFFQDVLDEDFAKVTSKLHPCTIPAGDVIIRQGDRGDSLFLIARGVVRVSYNENGQDHDLATLMAGDFFGEMALLQRHRRFATCRAVSPCSLYELRRKDFDYICDTCPAIKSALQEADRERRHEITQLTQKI